jgi:hypothetical protein
MITEITDFRTDSSLKDCVFTLVTTNNKTPLMTINIRGVVKAKQTWESFRIKSVITLCGSALIFAGMHAGRVWSQPMRATSNYLAITASIIPLAITLLALKRLTEVVQQKKLFPDKFEDFAVKIMYFRTDLFHDGLQGLSKAKSRLPMELQGHAFEYLTDKEKELLLRRAFGSIEELPKKLVHYLSMLDRSVPTEVTTAFQTFLDTHFTKNPEIIAVWAKNFEQHLPLELITDDPQIYFRVLFSKYYHQNLHALPIEDPSIAFEKMCHEILKKRPHVGAPINIQEAVDFIQNNAFKYFEHSMYIRNYRRCIQSVVKQMEFEIDESERPKLKAWLISQFEAIQDPKIKEILVDYENELSPPLGILK